MTSRKIDQFLFALGAALILISSYQLFLVRLSSEVGINLAVLEHTESVVKVKNSVSLDWRDAFSGIHLHDQQLLYTDKGSTAEIKFLRGNRINISENSLIRLTAFNQNEGLKVERGFIRAKIEENKPLRIEVNGSELILTGKDADVQISLQGGQGEIGVLKGEVSVEREGQVEVLDRASLLKLEAGKLEKRQVSFSLKNPKLQETIYTLNDQENVKFKWDPDLEATLLISNTPSFESSKQVLASGSAAMDLRPGSFYWKVEDASGSSITGSFHLILEKSPQILRPLDGDKIKASGEEAGASEVFLQWKGEPGAEYLVEWKDSQTHSQLVQTSGLMIPVVKSGQLEWRVKLSGSNRKLAPWSEWQRLEVEIIDPPKVPTHLSPSEIELQSYVNEVVDLELTWSSNPKHEIELEILSPKKQSELYEVQASSYPLKISETGIYKWRVRSKDELLRTSPWSEWKSFTLVDLSKESNSQGIQRIVLKRPDQLVSFSWKSEKGSTSVFELSESKDFKEVITKKEITDNEVKIVIGKTGNYFWRSRQYHSDGTLQVSEPVKVIVEPAPAPKKPEKLPDLEVPLEWRETSVKFDWWSLIISRAHADESRIVAKIKMPSNEDAKKFAIRIFKDSEGKFLVTEKIVEGAYFEWEGAKPGQYYWQYSVVDYWGRQSPYSDLSQLSVTELTATPPDKPRLLSPIRASKVKKENFQINWTESKNAKKYLLEVSKTKDFKEVEYKKETSASEYFVDDHSFMEGLYFWRVTATSKDKLSVVSNTGRFIMNLPPIERVAFVDHPEDWVKKYSKRFSFSWAPSSDTYEFEENGTKGKIDGTTLNSFEARGLYFTEQYIFSADLLRQSGKVFEEENYLFQRFQMHGTWKKTIGNHLWGPGISVGTVTGFSYEVSNNRVSSTSAGGFIYGPHLQGFYALSPLWELQGKASYMLGAIPHLELVSEANRKLTNFYLVFGFGYSMRDYAKGSGVQSSLKMNFGLGKEF
jgi:hypothetical protein